MKRLLETKLLCGSPWAIFWRRRQVESVRNVAREAEKMWLESALVVVQLCERAASCCEEDLASRAVHVAGVVWTAAFRQMLDIQSKQVAFRARIIAEPEQIIIKSWNMFVNLHCLTYHVKHCIHVFTLTCRCLSSSVVYGSQKKWLFGRLHLFQ